jgi:hypothetical protein
MCAFAVYLAEKKGHKINTTIPNYIKSVRYSIQALHAHDLRVGFKWERLAATLRALAKKLPAQAAKTVRLGILPQHLHRWIKELDLYKHDDLVCAALILTLWQTASRPGDVLPQTVSSFDPERHATLADLIPTNDGAELRIKDHKTKEYATWEPKFLPKGGELSALKFIQRLHRRFPNSKKREIGGTRATTPLFRLECGRTLAYHDCLRFTKRMADFLPPGSAAFGAQSYRIGGATTASVNKHATEASLKVLGYWLGNSHKIYTRRTRGAARKLARAMADATTVEEEVVAKRKK